MSKIEFLQIDQEQLVALFQQGIRIEVENLIKILSEQKPSKKEFLSRKETAEFFGVSVVTIHSWINEGLISSYKMGNRTYFKRSELIEQLLNSQKTVA